MSGYLLDTYVLSLLSPGRPDVPEGLEAWVDLQDRVAELQLSVSISLVIAISDRNRHNYRMGHFCCIRRFNDAARDRLHPARSSIISLSELAR